MVSAHDFEVDGIYYKIINENEVAVTYEGQYATSYQEYNGDVIIPPTVNYMSKTLTVTSVGEYAFYGCWGLTSITIPNSVTSIGGSAFYNCSGLSSVTIPNSVVSIGSYVINSCNNLISITVEKGNTVYDSRDNCNAIIETSSNTLIAGCKNTIIPNSVTSIGFSAFASCTGLTSIVIPNSVTSIGDGAFTYCHGLTSIVIPNSVTYIGNRAFSCAEQLTSITVESGNTVYDSRDNCNAIIETSSNTLIAGSNNAIIPNSVTKIGIYAFEGCSGLTSIIIPTSVRSIEYSAFSYCTGLTSIVIPNSVISIDKYAFSECEGLIRVDIGNSVISIGDWAFAYCVRLKNVYCYSSIPSSCSDNCFSDYSATLHVPAASMAVYFIAPCWSNFDDIIGDAIVPTEISMSKDSASLQLDELLQLTVTITPNNASNKEITWISTDTTVATVNNGMVLAVGYGECDIIASCFGMQVMCHVLVGNFITLDQQEAMLLPNHLLTLTPTPSLPGIYIVSSRDPTVAAARVLSSGKVQVVGIKEGTTTITVGSVDGTAIPATCLVTVYTEPGDINCDGFVNISDVTSLIDYLLSGDDSQISAKNADVNGDKSINISDVTELIDILLSGNG